MNFTLVGIEQHPWHSWLFIAQIVFGLWTVRRAKSRWRGGAIVLGGVLCLALRLPSPLSLQVDFAILLAGSGIDTYLDQAEKAPRKRWSALIWTVGCIPIVWLIWSSTLGQEWIGLGADQIATTVRNGDHKDANRTKIRVVELRAEDGMPLEWRIDRTDAVTDDKFVANTLHGELYRDISGNLVKAPEVAQRIAEWAGVQIAVEPISHLTPPN